MYCTVLYCTILLGLTWYSSEGPKPVFTDSQQNGTRVTARLGGEVRTRKYFNWTNVNKNNPSRGWCWVLTKFCINLNPGSWAWKGSQFSYCREKLSKSNLFVMSLTAGTRNRPKNISKQYLRELVLDWTCLSDPDCSICLGLGWVPQKRIIQKSWNEEKNI